MVDESKAILIFSMFSGKKMIYYNVPKYIVIYNKYTRAE